MAKENKKPSSSSGYQSADLGRSEAALAVAGQARTMHNGVDRISSRQRILEALEHDKATALAGGEPIGTLVVNLHLRVR